MLIGMPNSHCSRLLVVLCLLTPIATTAQSAPNAPPSQASFDGVWLGSLQAGPQTLRLQLTLNAAAPEAERCKMDSVDQKAFGIPCVLHVAADGVSFEVPAVSGKWTGTITADKTLNGSWTQGAATLPLSLTKQSSAIAAPAHTASAFDPAVAPVPVTELKSVLDRDLATAIQSGALAPATHTGVTIGVVQHGVRRIYTYGAAKPDSVFEIGSVTKTFTATILAQMVEQGKARLDEPVRELLPRDTVAKPASGLEITLLDLSDQHSGLPRMRDNFHPADPANPYADYDVKQLYAFVAKQGVSRVADAPFGYSNVGVGLLGQALANLAKEPYATLLQEQVLGPLGMRDTAIALTPSMQARFIQGYSADHKPAHSWELDALAGAGGLRSTAADMLTYLEAELHPEHLPAETLQTPAGKTLPKAIAKTHEIHGDAGGMEIALNWFRIKGTGSFWHNGGTGGYSAYALFNPAEDFGVVVLCNSSPGEGVITDSLGLHIAQRLQGAPAISLAPALASAPSAPKP